VAIVPVFYVLSIAALLNNVVGLAGPVLNSLNKPHILRNNRLIQLGFFVVLIYPFTKWWGMLGVGWVMVIFSVVSLIHFMPVLSKEIPAFYSSLSRILAKVLPSTFLMVAVVYGFRKLVPMNFFWLFALVFIGIVVYFIPMWFLDKELKWDVEEGWGVLKGRMKFIF